MPDFEVSAFNLATGLPLTTAVWVDSSAPPRTNPLAGRPHRYLTVPIGTLGVQFCCTVGGVLAPLDAALGGRLFLWSWVESFLVGVPPPIIPSAGHSSQVDLLPPLGMAAGRYLILAWRPLGGSVAVPFVAE